MRNCRQLPEKCWSMPLIFWKRRSETAGEKKDELFIIVLELRTAILTGLRTTKPSICFLRKNEAPDEPFYTIEVEPGGTIRQHRGMFDEEPDIELVKPFLREWQQVIRKRMKAEDHERAAMSKLKREENIEDLKQKNNTRVLAGLMEDFMEAVG